MQTIRCIHIAKYVVLYIVIGFSLLLIHTLLVSGLWVKVISVLDVYLSVISTWSTRLYPGLYFHLLSLLHQICG